MRRTLYITLICLTTFGWTLALGQPETILNELGKSLNEGGQQISDLIDHYSKALRYDSRNGAYYNNRAAAYFQKGQYRKSIQDYTQAIYYTPASKRSRLARMHYKRGLCKYILQEHHEALNDFTKAIAYRPDVTDSYYFRGKVLMTEMNKRSAGERDLRKVIQLSGPSSVQLAFSHYLLGNTRESATVVKKLLASTSIRDKDAYIQLHYNLAGLHGMIGNDKESVYYLEKALRNGYVDFEWLVRDPNFQHVAAYSGFQSLLQSYSAAYLLGGSSKPIAYNSKNCNCPKRPSHNPRDEQKPRQNEVPTRPRDYSSTPHQRPFAPADLKGFNLSFEDPGDNNRIDVEETSYISFVLMNQGRGDAKDVRVRLVEEQGIQGLEFGLEQKVGTVLSGAQKEVRIPIKGSRYLQSGEADFKLEIVEQNGFDAAPLHIRIPTLAFQPPQLEIVDYQFASELGGKMRQGMPITLRMAVQNTGQGTAEDVDVLMRLPENVFSASEKEFHIGSLQAGESKIIDFEFFTNRRYSLDQVPVLAEIKEKYGDGNGSKTMTIRINQHLEVTDRVVITAKSEPARDIQDIQLTSDVDRNLPRSYTQNKNAIAVIIGNRDYENSDVPPVDFALQDAASMKKYLIEVFGYDENNILFLPNATQADFNGVFGSKEDHKARLFNLIKAGESDIFVYYSGHGAPDLQTEEAYFVPTDCDPSLVKFNGYAINTFYENLGKMPYRSLTVVIDACFSGTSDRGTLMPNASLVRIKSGNNVLKDPKAKIFTSASGTQIASWYPDQSHSLFTYYFLKGIQGDANTNRDRQLTLEEMRGYLEQEVPYMARRLKNRVQTPEVYGASQQVLINY
ncbi:MAG: caspase family protein [Bacteroidota bacterium]